MLRERLEDLLRAGQSNELLEIADQYFAEPPAPSAESLWVAAYACRAASALKQWEQVIQWAERGLLLKYSDAEAQAWIQLLLGVAQMYRGNVYRAEKALDRFHRLASRSPHLRRLVPYGHFNRAILMRFTRRYDEEVRCLEEAATGFTQLRLTRQPLQCRLEIAWAHLLHNQPAHALAELERTAESLSLYGDAELELDAEVMWAFHHRLTGNLEAAAERCLRLLEDDRLLPRQRAEALWLLGAVAGAMGDQALARKYADQAFESAVTDYWPLQIERIEALRRLSVAN